MMRGWFSKRTHACRQIVGHHISYPYPYVFQSDSGLDKHDSKRARYGYMVGYLSGQISDRHEEYLVGYQILVE